METVQIVWLVLLVLFLVLEAGTTALVSIWFGAGALAALLVSLVLPGSLVAQCVVFAGVSILMLLLMRPLAHRLVGSRRVPTNADAAVGKLAEVTMEVRPEQVGRVKLEGQDWAARSDYVLPVGSWCRVLGIEGVKLVVFPLEAERQQENR